MGPKKESKDRQQVEGVKFHAREAAKLDGVGFEFVFEERPVSMMPADMILVRLVLAKVESMDRLTQLLRQIPIRQGEEEGWNCRFWVKEALLCIEQSKGVIGTSVLDWQAVRDAALTYC